MHKSIYSSSVAVFWLALCALLGACGGGGGAVPSGGNATVATYGVQPASCSMADQRTWLKAYMADKYFWNSNLNGGNESAASMDTYFQSLLYTPADRFSYTQSTTQFTQFFADGTHTGYGYSLGFADAAQTVLQVRLVEPQSPVAAAGLLRGDTIVSIDGYTGAQITSGALASVETAGVARSFTLRDAAGTLRNFTVTSAKYPLTPVHHASVLTAPNGAKVGYLAYQMFIASSASALGTAFNTFRAAGVTELIVDLRYNGGGSLTTARNLASMMGGGSLSGQTFARLRFNAQNSASNFSYAFTSSSATLPAAPLEGLNRVFVITSASTASASELLINALQPFRTVITIGAATFGKPYGFEPREACGITYNAVNFDSVNALGVGEFTSGLPVTCAVSDDLNKPLGDPTERRLAAALSYIQTGICPPVALNRDALQASGRASAFGDGVASTRAGAEPAFGEVTQPVLLAD